MQWTLCSEHLLMESRYLCMHTFQYGSCAHMEQGLTGLKRNTSMQSSEACIHMIVALTLQQVSNAFAVLLFSKRLCWAAHLPPLVHKTRLWCKSFIAFSSLLCSDSSIAGDNEIAQSQWLNGKHTWGSPCAAICTVQ